MMKYLYWTFWINKTARVICIVNYFLFIIILDQNKTIFMIYFYKVTHLEVHFFQIIKVVGLR